MLASLEQYILINCSDLLCGVTDKLTMMQLVNVYGLYRGVAKMNYPIPYSPEAERILFQLVTENEWDLPSSRIHLASLKWLFQQEKISQPLSYQILKFCQINCSDGNQIIVHGENSQSINLKVIAELATSGDNYLPRLLVCLLIQIVEEENQEHDVISVLNLLTTVIDISPDALDQLCLHGIGNAIRTVYHNPNHSLSPQIFVAISHLMFNILRTVHPKALCDDEAWLVVTVKVPFST